MTLILIYVRDVKYYITKLPSELEIGNVGAGVCKAVMCFNLQVNDLTKKFFFYEQQSFLIPRTDSVRRRIFI